MPEVRVELLQPDEIEALFAFRARALPDNAKRLDRERWRWLFQQNPCAEGTLPVWVLKADGVIVGCIAAIPCQVRLGDAEVTAYFGADYFVDEGFKGLPALRLLRAMQAHSPLHVGANLSPSAQRLFLKMGYVDLSADLFAASAILPTAADRGLKARLKRLLWGIARGGSRLGGRRCTLESGLPVDYDDLWNVLVQQRGTGQVKDGRWLRWRYEACPHVTYRFLACRRHGQLCGLAVVARLPDGSGLVADLLVGDGDRLSLMSLVAAALTYFTGEGAGSCQLHSNRQALRPLLRALGFHLASSDLGLAVLVNKAAPELAVFQRSAGWHFSLGDTDRY